MVQSLGKTTIDVATYLASIIVSNISQTDLESNVKFFFLTLLTMNILWVKKHALLA